MHWSTKRRNSRPSQPCRCVAVAMTLAMAITTTANADESEEKVIAETSGTSYSRSASAGWNISTGNDATAEKMPRPKSSLTIRAYEGFRTLRPYYGNRLAYGVDVTAEIEACPNGTDRISTLNIGGWLYEVDGDCSDYQGRTKISVSKQEQTNNEESAEAVLNCDPATWRCRTIER